MSDKNTEMLHLLLGPYHSYDAFSATSHSLSAQRRIARRVRLFAKRLHNQKVKRSRVMSAEDFAQIIYEVPRLSVEESLEKLHSKALSLYCKAQVIDSAAKVLGQIRVKDKKKYLKLRRECMEVLIDLKVLGVVLPTDWAKELWAHRPLSKAQQKTLDERVAERRKNTLEKD